jgi:hypothetical protein
MRIHSLPDQGITVYHLTSDTMNRPKFIRNKIDLFYMSKKLDDLAEEYVANYYHNVYHDWWVPMTAMYQ